MTEKTAEMPVGVVIRKQPGVTRWAKWVWRAVGVLPGAGPAEWHEMRREDGAIEYHAATCTLEVLDDDLPSSGPEPIAAPLPREGSGEQ